MKQESEFKLFFESLPGLYLVLLPDLTIRAVSDDYLSATYTSRKQILGKYLFDIIARNTSYEQTDSINNLHTSLNLVLESRKTNNMSVQRYDVQKKDGSYHVKYWIPVNKPILDSSGNITYIIHRVEEVTDLITKAQNNHDQENHKIHLLPSGNKVEIKLISRSEELTEIQRQLEKIIEDRAELLSQALKDVIDYKIAIDSTSIVSVTDVNGVIQYANNNFCTISKYTKEELKGQTHRIINSGYHSKIFFKLMWETIASGTTWKGELKNKAKDGSLYWVDTTIVPFKDEEGNVYKYLSIRTDITDRKKLVEDLILSEENYRNLFENALVGISTADLNTYRITDVNDYCAHLLGYNSREELINTFEPKNHFEKYKDREEIRSILKGQPKGHLIKHDQKIRRVDGSILWVDLYIKLGREESIVQIIIIDVTKQKLSRDILEKKVAKRTNKLTMLLKKEKELNGIKSRFVSFASHEFRTPLTVIFSSASLEKMYAQKSKQPSREKLADSILSSVRDLTGILDNFLSLAKLENGKTEVLFQPFMLPKFIKDIVKEMAEVTGKKKQTIYYTHEGETEMIQSKGILKNILLNLLTNASKYSKVNQPIQITSFIGRGHAVISILDHGIGIPEKDQKHLFSEFFRAGNVGNISGTGLGLNIVKKYIELLQGTIEFTSNDKEGTCFVINIPQWAIQDSISAE